MKRRNAECGKLRRPLKRNKITEGIYGSTFLYLKFLMIWALVLLADFILEFRFEYLWPFWLLLRSVYDSFKYQGLAFSVFFICIAFTSDMVCLLFIPVHWLFFAASTYVWVQFVWHTERGICLPTISLWLLFVYIEASVRLRELRTALPFHLDLCRPFAAHCIGYPMVTLGFGVKSYVSYRMRLRKQKEVAKDNEFYMQLLQQALPPEQQTLSTSTTTEKTKAIAANPSEEIIANGVSHKKGASIPNGTSAKGSIDPEHKVKEKKQMSNNNSSLDPTSSTDSDFAETKLHSKRSNPDFDGTKENLANESLKSFKANSANVTPKSKNATMAKENTLAQSKKKNSAKTEIPDFTSNVVTTPYKEDKIYRLEADIKRLKADLQSSRQTEQDLRSQIMSLQLEEKSTKTELQKMRDTNESLQARLHNLVTQKQQDKQNLSKLEQKLKQEKESRSVIETQLRDERKNKKAEEAASVAMASVRMGECSDSCKARRMDLTEEIMSLKKEHKEKDEVLKKLEKEIELLRKKEETLKETEILMSHLSVMQDKNAHLENSLSAETRLKLDLFSALGDAKRQLEIAQGQLEKKDMEINELKSKIAEVMAVMPSSSYPSTVTSTVSSVTPRYSASFCNLENDTHHVGSSLDPNASVYHPKQN
ncbi:macoilin-like [Ptychodera flava]|uniref:macoilin-like n=1 Tax=Ptychodera flava TaxID=63121 RepID=UPI00396A05B9